MVLCGSGCVVVGVCCNRMGIIWVCSYVYLLLLVGYKVGLVFLMYFLLML